MTTPSKWITLSALALLLIAGAVLLRGIAQPPTAPQAVKIEPGELLPVAISKQAANLPQARFAVNGETFTLEVAIDAASLEQGLMYRKSLPQQEGMLFPFMPRRNVSFWMKNTFVPLDMVFIRDHQVTHVVQNAPPCRKDPCPVYPSQVPVDMVVELPAGTAQRLSIDHGTPVRIFPPDETAAEPILTTPDAANSLQHPVSTNP